MENMSIEKLNKQNYDTWKLQMQALLIKSDRWNFVNGLEIKPTITTTAADQKLISDWIKNDQKAKADIILAINPSELCHIKHCETSSDAWKKLKDIYESKGPARKATLLKQLLFTKMTYGITMQDHLNTLFNTVDKLNEMEVDITDDLLTIIILYSIPDSYENFRIAIESRDELPKPDALKIKLLEEYNARKEKDDLHTNNPQAYFSNSKSRRAYQPPPYKNKMDYHPSTNHPLKCYYCQKLGHRASECRKKLSDAKRTKSYREDALTATCDHTQPQSDIWCLDSGATSHMCYDENRFEQLEKINDTYVKLAVDKQANVIGKGTIKFKVQNGTQPQIIKLKNVLCVPELKNNLISVSKASNYNNSITFTRTEAKIKDTNGKTILKAIRAGDLYYVNTLPDTAYTISEMHQWHLKYGHLNEQDLKKLHQNKMVRGMTFNPNSPKLNCKICIQSKQTSTPLPKTSKYESTELLNIIHSDVCGPMRCKSIGGATYFVTFIDDKSRYVDTYFLKSKNEVKETFVKYKAMVENRTNQRIKILRTDNGLEYLNNEFNGYLEKEGIRRQRTAAYTPQQNGRAERMNRTLVEMARCLLLQSQMPTKFWAEAINTATYIRNRCPTNTLKTKTPYEVQFNTKPTVIHFKTFGQKAYYLNKKPQKGKFEQRSYECKFIGYSNECKAYRLWDEKNQKVITSRDVKFIEEFETSSTYEEDIEQLWPKNPINQTTVTEDAEREGATTESAQHPLASQQQEGESNQTRNPGRPTKSKTGKPGRPKKIFHSTKQATDETNLSKQTDTTVSETDTPTVKEAMKSDLASKWKDAMRTEYEALTKMGTWKLVNRPTDKKVIGSKWVLRIKRKADGTIDKYKARLVAKGYSQLPDIDYTETFAPVARLSSIRTVLAYCAEMNLTLYQFDFVMAYINGDIDEEIFMEQPEEFEEKGKEHQVCLLQKSLYGLKQAGRQWYKKLDDKLKSIGLKPLNADTCIYHKKSQEGELIIMVYVDDLIVATSNPALYQEIKQDLTSEFDMKDLGKLHYCLGIKFTQNEDNNEITMSQGKHIEDVLKKYNMEDTKPAKTPMDISIKLNKGMCPTTEEEKTEMNKYPYRSLIGSLMYLAVGTRPDIAYAISHLSQFNENPGKAHWIAAKHVLKYLKGTLDTGLTFKQSGSPLIGYADADWGSNTDDRRSYTGYIFHLAGGAITWESRKQRTVALSSTEAEYMSLAEAAREATYLRKLLKELLGDNSKADPTVILCDNQGAQKIARNPVFHQRTKHIDIKHHYIREVLESGEIDIKFTETNTMAADILTKALTPQKHSNCCKIANIKRVII